MVKAILFIVSILLIVIGLCDFFYLIRSLFFYPGCMCNNYIVVMLKNKYALRQLNYIWQKIRWHGNAYANGIIAITDFLDFNEIFDCLKYIKGKNIVLCDFDSLSQCECLQGDFLDGNR